MLNGKIKVRSYAELIRLHRPVGIFLLLWPIWWSLWLAAQGLPPVKLLLIFTVGVVLMRSAGCIINDLADQKFDGNVARTKNRPLVTGLISRKEALTLFVMLCLIAFILVLQLNWLTIALSFVALGLSILYPFTKRIIYFPQVILGMAWYTGILMAFTATNEHINLTAWLLYIACIIWAVVYDSMYAMVDREDDVVIGVKSTAILFGHYDKFIIAILQIIVILLLLGIGYLNHLRWPFYLGISAATLFFLYQQFLIKDRVPERCLNAFINNHWVGASIFVGLFLSLI
jgi:4-hydroxybenzoate polyprenyltransferase